MADISLKVGDLEPSIHALLLADDGTPMPLAGATVAFRLRLKGAAAVLFERSATIVDVATSEVSYAWQTGDTDAAGLYVGEFRVTISGRPRTHPNASHLTIQIHARA